ncbi:MAG: PAS domain S-box protein [Myxococcaceae bacterium]|nr:PAS domain S-box protein [Myxococcaceae bacterium]
MRAPDKTSKRLARHKSRVLELLQQRMPSSQARHEPLLEHVVLSLEGAPLGTQSFAAGHDALECLRAVVVLEDILFEVLEQEEPLTPEERSGLRTACCALRDAALELVQSREEQLRGAAVKSEERYLTVTRTTGFAVWDWDLKDAKLHWSYSVESLLGHPIDALSSLVAWLDYVHAADRDRVESGLREALEGGRSSWSDSFRFLRRDGTYSTVLARGWILHDAAGSATRVVGGLNDVTEQRRLERELKQQQLLTQAVAENAASCLFMVDAGGVTTYLNPAASAVTGYRLEDLRGKLLHDVLHPKYPDGSQFPVEACEVHRPKASARDHECVFLRSDGTEFSVSCSVMPLSTGEVGAVIEFRDITRQKAQHQQLVDAVQGRDEFLAVASHELRTPLTALQLQLQLVTHGPLAETLDERVKGRLGRAEQSLGRLVELVNELLDVSKLRAGRIDLEPKLIDGAAVVREVVQRLTPSLRDVGSELALNVPERSEGHWDRTRFDQVFTNLYSNAIKYGDGKPIEVEVTGDDGWLVLSVRDHGIGIALADQARIFERFERAVSERHYGGFGLGLWIVKRIVGAMGGTIKVESTPGDGSRFEVRLPRRHGVAP